METASPSASFTRRRPLAALGKLAIAVLIGIALLLVRVIMSSDEGLDPPLLIFIAVALVCAGVVAMGWRWAPLLATLLSAAMLAGYLPTIGSILTHPDQSEFAVTVIFLPLALVGICTGIAATVQNYRPGERRAPRWLAGVLAGIGGVVVGVLVGAQVAQDSAQIEVSQAALANLPVLRASSLRFDQTEMHARAGETVALRLENGDTIAHRFDSDAFDVHVPIAPKRPALAVFRPLQPGTYIFYCGVPGHRESGMRGTLIVDP